MTCMTRQYIAFLTSAEVNAEGGLSTFRCKDGMFTNIIN